MSISRLQRPRGGETGSEAASGDFAGGTEKGKALLLQASVSTYDLWFLPEIQIDGMVCCSQKSHHDRRPICHPTPSLRSFQTQYCLGCLLQIEIMTTATEASSFLPQAWLVLQRHIHMYVRTWNNTCHAGTESIIGSEAMDGLRALILCIR